MEILPERVSWFIVGPLIGVLVAGLFAVANRPLGASGSYVQTMAFVRGDKRTQTWRVWYFVGIIFGALLASILQGKLELRSGYESMLNLFSLPLTVVVLAIGGVVMGYGARMSGGCTSGHGLCGTSARSMTGFAATATFMLVAIAVTLLLNWITGGRL